MVSPLPALAQTTHVVASADTHGLLGPCPKCPGDPLQGGLPRRATLVSDMRSKLKPMLLVDAGNALFGDETVLAGPKIILDAYDAMGYDVVNIAWEDFRGGKELTMDSFNSAKLSAISANLLDESSGKSLFSPFAVKEVGGVKFAIVGITEPPALPDLPHIKRQLTGIRVDAPDHALQAILGDAKSQAKSLILLYHGSASGLSKINRQFGNEFAAIIVGGTVPGEVPNTEKLFTCFGNGRTLMDVSVSSDGTCKGRTLDVASSLKPDPAMQKLVDDYGAKRDQIEQLAIAPAAKQSGKSALKPALEKLDAAGVRRIDLAGKNSAVELKVTSVALLDRYGDAPAPTSKAWLAIGTNWTNLQPARLIDGKSLPVQYLIPKLADNLYCVVNGARVLSSAEVDAPGTLGKGSLRIENQGDVVSGTLLYPIARDTLPDQLALRFYDFAHGNIFLPIVGTIEVTPVKPVVAPVKNEVVELGAYSVKRLDTFDSAKAPDGMTFLSVELRGRSTVVQEVDASGFTPGAKKGQKLRIGTVADWKDSRQYLQLVVDGVYAYSPLKGSNLPEIPRFLPDLMTGDCAVFLIPSASKSLELRCDFPNAAVPGQAQVLRPKGLTLQLEGREPQFTRGKPILTMEDPPFKIAINEFQSPPMFAGQKPAADRRFIVMQVIVENAGKNGEFFQTRKQLQYAMASGETLPFDPATEAGLHPSGESLWIPGGERRVFEIAFAVPIGESKPRLAFTGATAAKVYDLPALAAMQETPSVKAPDTTAPPAVKESEPPKVAETVSQPPSTQPAQTSVSTASSSKALDIVRPARTPKGLAGVGLTGQQVNAAIDKGSAALWNSVSKGYGVDSEDSDPLVGLALVHADAHKKYPAFDLALRKYLTAVEPRSIGTYQAGLLAMLIESYGDPAFIPKFNETVRYLLEAQGPKGTWTYNVKFPETVYAAPVQQEALQISGGKPLDGAGAADEQWKRLTAWTAGKDGDNSVSQFALLGLNAASRSGFKLPSETWKRMLAITLKRQCKDGGWSYEDPGGAYGSMTCAGICATAICRHELGEKEPADDPAIAGGITWLTKNFTVKQNPEKNDWVYYYLYSLERVGRILDTEFIGENEWYPQGALRLVSTQPANGLWVGEGNERDPRLATSFALLFLTRATPTLKIQPKHGGDGTLLTAITSAPVMRLFVIMDCSGSMLEEMQGAPKLAHSQAAVISLIDQLPEGSEFGLRAYGHRRRAIEKDADEDTELVIPMGKLDKPAATETVKALRARGRTPMALSIEESVGDIKAGDVPVTVILLTDGGEDTQPRRDPVKASAMLGAVSNVRFNIVGFDINQEDWSQSLQAMAAAGHARYWPAGEAQALIRQMQSAVFGIPDDFTVKDAKGDIVFKGKFGEKHKLPEGKYTLRAEFSGQVFEKEFWINTDALTTVGFDASKAPMAAAHQPPKMDTPQSPPKNPVAKFCSNCGKPLQPGDRFCRECGAKTE
jgi:hypothetical protein